MLTETFKKYSPEELRPGSSFQSDEELVQEGSKFTQTIFHPVGTCKMGNDENIHRTKIPNTCMNTEDSTIVEHIQVMVNVSYPM